MGRLLIRADGGKETGLGHWSRCLFLATCVEPSREITFYVRDKTLFDTTFPDARVEVVQIEDEEDFFSTVNARDLVILDGYSFDATYVDRLNALGALIIYIDDLFAPGIRADVVINHCPGIQPALFEDTALHTSWFLGGKYSLVSNTFAPSSYNFGERINNILLCMGGADPHNKTVSIVQKYRDFFLRFDRVDIIVGSAYQHIEGLKAECGDHQRFNIHKNLDKRSISKLMQRAGVAVLPSSTMALEYAHVGGVLYVVQTAENQKYLYKGLLSSGTALDISDVNDFDCSPGFYEKIRSKQLRQFDGHSHERYSKLFRECALQQQMTLRKATMDDARVTYKWATDKNIRSLSFSSDEITWEGHCKWFESKVNSDQCFYYLAKIKERFVGSVRFDLSHEKAVINYLLDVDYQGQGLGRVLLAEGIRQLTKEQRQIEEIVGYVMDTNIPSIRIFERLGFQRGESDIEQPGSIKFIKHSGRIR
ncbi:hypothetical protein C900_03570 [Fulvivirga imtechensis AK7]|uniref:N-acetyltransferase domain-containing protein n=1 Tax=Fulvivirga imtechensis AK7 TaxID=1237149 RepID=L8JSW7_9BACT|nr:bifunctional UDP-2,4-diacetamido-2,4,6-trideoxy-beta-L-altropyranose hydrolase/GNAT family N-acetyltransferase [Fulvivirga imtechensis]ELR70589.1 hypothetical protein C900_03570 [Fulvivirga imtechensis AK7]